ncbi:glutamate receptor 2.8-like protein [Tanacetum coccineum]
MGNIDLLVNKQHLLMPCPCKKCLNHIEHKVEEVQFHLFRNGIDLSYTNWTRHGEKDEPSISAPEPINATTEFVCDTNFALDIPTDGPATVEMVNATKIQKDTVKYQQLPSLLEGWTGSEMLSNLWISNVRLQQLFKIQSISEDLRWHATRRITDGVLRHLADSQAWRTIDEKFPKIAKDPRNLRLGISADGVDVNTRNRKQKKAFNGQQEFLPALIPMTREQIYNEVQHIENK